MELSFQWMLMERGASPPACQVDIGLQISLPVLYLDSMSPRRLTSQRDLPCVHLLVLELVSLLVLPFPRTSALVQKDTKLELCIATLIQRGLQESGRQPEGPCTLSWVQLQMQRMEFLSFYSFCPSIAETAYDFISFFIVSRLFYLQVGKSCMSRTQKTRIHVPDAQQTPCIG